ncbi:MAG: hypothetical protein ACR2RE_26420 [Geminicoccaceae bacterium]
MADPLHVRLGIVPRGLTREDAAEYCGVTAWTLDKYVQRNLLPGPMPGTKRWDRKALDIALDRLSNIAAPSVVRQGVAANVGKAARAVRR